VLYPLVVNADTIATQVKPLCSINVIILSNKETGLVILESIIQHISVRILVVSIMLLRNNFNFWNHHIHAKIIGYLREIHNCIYFIHIRTIFRSKIVSSFIVVLSSAIVSINLAPGSSPVIFINANPASLLIDAEESCIRKRSCFNIVKWFNRDCRPSWVPVIPVYIQINFDENLTKS